MKKIFKLLAIASCLMPIACFAQFNFIGRKINPNQPKPIPSIPMKSGKGIPSLDFKFDSIRPLVELKNGNDLNFPWLSPDGNRIYYTEENLLQLYMAEKKPGKYKFSNPHLLSINGIDTSSYYYSAWLTNDELNIYFVQAPKNNFKFYLCHSKRDSINHNFSTLVRVKLNSIGNSINTLDGPSFTQDSNQLYIANQSNGISKPINGICIFNKTGQDDYTYSDTLPIPNNYSSGVGTLTSDDLSYFLCIMVGQSYRLYVFKRDSIKEKFTKLYYINNPSINDTNYQYVVTPYFSISNNILAFSKLDSGYAYTPVVIYLAYNFREFDNIEEYIKKSGNINIYPNPVETYLEIIPVEIYHSFDYYLTNLSGQIKNSGSFNSNTTLDVSSLAKGIYILRLIDKKNNLTSYHKILKI